MFQDRGTGPEWSVRRQVVRRAVGVGMALALVVGIGAVLPKLRPFPLRLLATLPADPRCGHPIGQLATLARGEGLPDEPCLAELANTPFVTPILVRMVRDGERPVAVRISALTALNEAGAGPTGLLESLVVAPSPPPALRRAAWKLATRKPSGTQWVERGGIVAAHGLYDRAAARRYADGEPGSALGAARALDASPRGAPDPGVLGDVYAGLGTGPAPLEEAVRRHAVGQMALGLPPEWASTFWRHGCEDACVPLLVDILGVEADRWGEEAGPPAPAVPGADAALDALHTGERADHVREELAAVARWIATVSESRRAARLIAAVLHPDAAPLGAGEALAEAGDLHAVLVRGGGTPGATALVAADLALATRVPLSAWVTDTGVALQVGGRVHRVDGCLAAREIDAPDAGWREVPTGGLDALALVEAAARALREDDLAAAQERLSAARRVWPDAPGLDGVTAAVLAIGGLVPAEPEPSDVDEPPSPDASALARASASAGAQPVANTPVAGAPPSAGGMANGLAGVVGPDVLFVSRPTLPPPRRSRRAPLPPPDLRAEARAALLARLHRIEALATDPEDRIRAAWWAARAGDHELTRRLLGTLPGAPDVAPDGPAAALRAAAARAAGEPAVPMEPAPAAAAHAAPSGSCPAPFRADPPLWAWTGAPPRGD